MHWMLTPLASRVLLGLLILTAGLVPLLPPAAVTAEEGLITLEAKWLVLRTEDFTRPHAQKPDQITSQNGVALFIRRFEPDWRGQEGHPPFPDLVLNQIWQAPDIATAQQIFREQADAGFPDRTTAVNDIGGFPIPALGDEAHGITGCGPCDSGYVHHRVVFRYLNAVHSLYVYGPRDYANGDVVHHWALILDERVRAVPSGPMPDVVAQVTPRDIALGAAELGREINTIKLQDGGDDRAQWFESRFNRAKELETAHVGPLDIYSKVWVARDVETAQQIYNEQARPGMPEAVETVGNQFPSDYTPGVGNENFAWSACNETCMTVFFRFLHHRYVWRTGNVVAVIYTWGGDQDNSLEQVTFYANSMRNRIK